LKSAATQDSNGGLPVLAPETGDGGTSFSPNDSVSTQNASIAIMNRRHRASVTRIRALEESDDGNNVSIDPFAAVDQPAKKHLKAKTNFAAQWAPPTPGTLIPVAVSPAASPTTVSPTTSFTRASKLAASPAASPTTMSLTTSFTSFQAGPVSTLAFAQSALCMSMISAGGSAGEHGLRAAKDGNDIDAPPGSSVTFSGASLGAQPDDVPTPMSLTETSRPAPRRTPPAARFLTAQQAFRRSPGGYASAAAGGGAVSLNNAEGPGI
jgi:hypothetical protein